MVGFFFLLMAMYLQFSYLNATNKLKQPGLL